MVKEFNLKYQKELEEIDGFSLIHYDVNDSGTAMFRFSVADKSYIYEYNRSDRDRVYQDTIGNNG